MKTTVIVTAHKPYWMPADRIYLPVQVGAGIPGAPALGFQRDDDGENISKKNKTFCELTGLYWAWKNTDAEVYGLCHYRRYLGNRRWWKPAKQRLLTETEIGALLDGADVLLPRKRHYVIETRGSQYAHAHHAEDLRCMEQILRERCPAYLPAWNWMLKTRSGHICNMFIMRREHFRAYCAWLFDLLFEAEARLDISAYAEKDRRVFGYLAERLLDVWIRTEGLSFREAPMICLEKQHWAQKGAVFLKRKLRGHG